MKMEDYDTDLLNKVIEQVKSIRDQLDNIDTMIADVQQCKNAISKKVLLATVQKYLLKISGTEARHVEG